jgi:hypothetical protein
VLRLWLDGHGFRTIERLCGIDRKTVRRYVMAAVEAGLDRAGGEEQLTDEFLSVVVEKVPPQRLEGHGEAWRLLEQRASGARSGVEDSPRSHTPDRGVVINPAQLAG